LGQEHRGRSQHDKSESEDPMAANKRERMSSVDTAWLRMDRPSNLMMICGVLIFRERLDFGRLQAIIADRFLSFPRFRQRPLQTPAGVYWETDKDVDLSAHVQRIELPRPAGKSELQALASDLISAPLDSARPMWQFHLVEHYDGRSALIARIHHCYADGIALIQVMLSLTDTDRAGKAPRPVPEPPRRAEGDADAQEELLQPLSGAMKTAQKLGTMLIEKGVELWREPSKAVAFVGKGRALTDELAQLLLMGEDSATRFKGEPGVAKRVAWTDPIALDEVKTIGKALDCSVNDVLLSSVAGALRAYLVGRGDRVAGVSIRALVPVNLRPPEKAYRLGNHFGLVFLDLPIGIENPIERLYAVRANMRSLKDSYQPVLALGILAAMGSGPKMLQDQLLAMLSKNATAVMTNVPGPQQPLYLAGARIDNLMFWVPQSGDIAMGVSILSYDGAVQFGLVTDRAICPDPEHVIDRFGPEFERLVLATLMAPWPWTEPPRPEDIERAVFQPA